VAVATTVDPQLPTFFLHPTVDCLDRRGELIRLDQDVQIPPDTVGVIQAVHNCVVDCTDTECFRDELGQLAFLKV
jgi:hypothetical protein